MFSLILYIRAGSSLSNAVQRNTEYNIIHYRNNSVYHRSSTLLSLY